VSAESLDELETKVNAWMKEAEKKGLQVEYLGEVNLLANGTFYYVVDYCEPYDPEEVEHHG
jgi:hypothetical protein